MRALGIDFGERRIGLALSDPRGHLAMPLLTLERTTDRRAVHRIADLARQHEVTVLILGEPRGPDGQITPGVERVRRFGGKLAAVTRLPVHYLDETLTTVGATERLREAGMDRDPRDRSGRRDAVAAQILLEEALRDPDLLASPRHRADEPRTEDCPPENGF